MEVSAQSVNLPVVSGTFYDGREITWNPVPNAIGYDIYMETRYLTTVVGTTSYRPEEVGFYVIAAFDVNGNYSPTFPSDQNAAISNFVAVEQLADGVDKPMNVSGIVYSLTAGEMFWDRSLSRNLEYEVFLNGESVGTTQGGSMFIDSLPTGVVNQVSVVALTLAGESSEQVMLEFDTQTGPFPSAATATDTGLAAGMRPESPLNPEITVYGGTSAELFWDRPSLDANIVSTDVFRDGELLGSAQGNSFFDGTGTFIFDFINFGSRIEIPHTYELVAIDSSGNRSLPATLNPSAFDPGAFDDSNLSISRRLMAGISDVTTDNIHLRVFPQLQRLANGGAAELLDIVSVEPIVENNVLLYVRTQYQCAEDFRTEEPGTLIVEQNAAISSTRMFFDDCLVGFSSWDGGFTLTGLDAGGYSAIYDNFLVEDTISMQGEISLAVASTTGSEILTYSDFQYDWFRSPGNPEELSQSITLNQKVADADNDQPGQYFETNFTGFAPWTNGQELTITTTERFEDIVISEEPGTPNYTTGALVAETGNGETFVWSAGTGDDASWTSTVTQADGVSETFFGLWTDSVRLPCISVTLEFQCR